MTLKARMIPRLEKQPPVARRQRFSFSPTGEKEAGRTLHVQGPTALPRAARATAQPRSGEDAQNEKMEAVL